jgi:hypothetical protein
MQQIELEPIIESVSEKFWNARTILNGREGWSELDLMTKHAVQNQAIPFVAYSVPAVFKQFEKQILDTISSGEELGVDPATILLSIKATLAERS